MAYIVRKGDNLASISSITGSTPSFVKMYHNLRSSDYITNEIKEGMELIVPADFEDKLNQNQSQPAQSVPTSNDMSTSSASSSLADASSTSSEKEEHKSSAPEPKQEENEEQKKSPSSSHTGKLFVVQKGQAECNQGNMKPKFVVKSHNRLFLNKSQMTAESLIVLDADTTFMPPGPSFGQCKLKPTSGGYLPCSCSPVGKWQKVYDDTTVDGHKAITEMSELMCAIGGKITVFKHGQVSEMSQQNVDNANPKAMNRYNPAVDFEAYKSELNDDFDYQ